MSSDWMSLIKEKIGDWIAAFVIILVLAAMSFPCGLFLLCTWLFGVK